MVLGKGAVASCNTWVSSFMSVYILMVGIGPTVAAAVLLVLKAWDAINDVLFGYIVDKYRFNKGKNWFTRWVFKGRYMPWFRLLFFLVPIGTMILFSINTNLPMWLRVAQYFIGYFIFDLGTTGTAAYDLLPLTLTHNYDERNFIISWNGLGQGFGALPVAFLGTVFVAGSLGYTGAAAVFCLLGVVLAMIPMLLVKEQDEDAESAAEQQEKYTVREMFRVIRQLPELIWLMIGVFCWGIFYTSGYGLFVAYYIFNNAYLSIIMTLCATIPSIILIPFLPSLFQRVDKIVVARVACLDYVVCGVIINFLGSSFFVNHLPVLYVLIAVQTTGYVMVMFAGSQMTVDLVEIAKYRTGTDAGGIISAAYNFVNKLVNSMVSSVTLLILGWYGFVSVEADSFEELAALNAQGIGLQTERALTGLWNVTYLFPVFGFALAGIAFCFVHVSRKKVRIIMSVNNGEISREEGEQKMAALS